MARRFEVIHACVGGGDSVRASVDRRLRTAGLSVIHVEPTELASRLPEMRVLLCGIPPRIDWSSATSLALLQIMGSGVEVLWPADGLPESVMVTNARGIHLPEMRDHALACMLALERRIPEIVANQREHRWRSFTAGTLSGKTVGILGLGEVGRSLAEACAGLGMRVIGTRMHPQETPHVERVHGSDDLDAVLREADHLVVLLPLTERTRRLVNAQALAKMRRSAVLVHLSRGGVVDEGALAAALRTGALRGAAVDVFEEEPLPPESPLWDTQNLLISPHLAGWSSDYVERALEVFVHNLEALECGELPHTLVDRRRQY